MFRHSVLRRSGGAVAPSSSSSVSVLDRLITHVSSPRLRLKPDDIFKLCALANGRDGAALGLLGREQFVVSVRDAAVAQQAALSPFQLSQAKELCAKSGIVEWSPNSTSTSSSSRSDASGAASDAAGAEPAAPNVESKKQSAGNLPKSNLWDETTVAKQEQRSAEAASATDALDVAGHGASPSSSSGPYIIEEGSPPQLQQVMDALHSARHSFHERNTYDLRSLQRICDETLAPLVPFLKPGELSHITGVLAHINHQDYTLAQHLSRRACQCAAAFSVGECCRMLVKLYRLKVHDSLTVLVRRIERDLNNLPLRDLVAIVNAAQLQSQTTASLQPLVARALYLLAGRVGEGHLTIAQLVACVEVAAKFGQGANPSVRQLVEGAARRAAEMNDRALASTLQSAHAMGLITTEAVFHPLAERAVQLAGSMDVRFLEGMLDVMSLLPFNAARFMDAVLLRLADDAGQLQPHALVSVLELLSSYPGARGSTAVPALALAACMRKEVLDQQAVASLLLSLAQLGQLSDEFFQLFEFLLVERKGFKEPAEVVELLGHLPPAREVADTRFAGMVSRAVVDLVQSMTHDEALEAQRQLQRVLASAAGGVDRNLARRLEARLESLQMEASAAERAAAEAALRRQTHHQQQQQQPGGNSSRANSAQTTRDWDNVQPRVVNESGWGEPSSSSPAAAARQQPQMQPRQPAPHQAHPQQQQQQRVSTARPSRPAAPSQQQKRNETSAQSKKAQFRKSQWDGFIE